MVEAAIVLPVVLLLVLGIMEYGRYLMMLQVLDNASRESARYAVSHLSPVVINNVVYGNSTTDVSNVFDTYRAGLQLQSQSFQVYCSDSLGNNLGTWTNAQAGQAICTRVTGNFQFFVPSLLGLPSTLPVDIKTVMHVEGN